MNKNQNDDRPDAVEERKTRITFPPEPIVMPPSGTWRRLPDGQIEAYLTITQLRQMVAIKRGMEAEAEVEKEVVRSTGN